MRIKSRFGLGVLAAVAAIAVALLATLSANAAPAPPDSTLTVSRTGIQQGTVTDSDGQINCGGTPSDCTGSYPATCELENEHGACTLWATGVTTLSTTPPAGFGVFWSGQTCQSEGSQTTNACTVDGSGTVNARFDDLTDPNVSLTAPLEGARHRGTISLAATAGDAQTGIAHVRFLVGGVQVDTSDTSAPYGMSFDTTSRSDGPVVVKAVAQNGDGDPSESQVSITIDNTAPALNVSGPDGQTFGPGSTQSWTYTASDTTSGPPTVQCSVTPTGASPSYGSCAGSSGTHSVSHRPDGSYVFRARATDGAGNTTEVSRSFSIDGTAPDTVIGSGPADGSSSSSASATFGFSATEPGSTFKCRVYPAALTAPAFGPCSDSGSHSASGFSPGTYAFEVVATDAYGNVDPSAARRTFTVAPAGAGDGPAGTGGANTGPGDATPPSWTFKAAALQRVLRARALVFTVTPSEACSLTVIAKLGKVKLGSLKKSLAGGAAAKLKLRLSSKGLAALRAKLKRARTAQISLSLSCVDAASLSASSTKKVKVRR